MYQDVYFKRSYLTLNEFRAVSTKQNANNRGQEVRASLEILEQNDRLMELILDISNELDIDVLCHKILLNIGHLTKADRCSLFLARGPRENRYLEAKLFDVSENTSKNDKANGILAFSGFLYIIFMFIRTRMFEFIYSTFPLLIFTIQVR